MADKTASRSCYSMGPPRDFAAVMKPLAAVARVSGYQSETAFGKVLRREFAVSPGQFRRQAHARSHTPSQLELELNKRDPFSVPEQEVGLNLMKTAEAMREPFVSLMQRHGLIGSQYNILRILRGNATAQSQDDLSKQLLGPQDDIQPLVDQLVTAKHVSLSDNDGMLSITKSGKQLLTKLDDPIIASHRRQLSHLSEGELVELNRLLVKARDSAA